MSTYWPRPLRSAVDQRGDDGGGGVQAGVVIHPGLAGLQRVLARIAGDRDRTGGGLHAHPDGLAVGERALLPVAAHRDIDEPREALLEVVVAEAHAPDRARREVLRQDVGVLEQPHQDLATLLAAQVELHRALARVAGREVLRAVVPEVPARVVAREEARAHRVRRLGTLDLDHVRAEVTEDPRHHRADPDLREVDDLQALEEAHARPSRRRGLPGHTDASVRHSSAAVGPSSSSSSAVASPSAGGAATRIGVSEKRTDGPGTSPPSGSVRQ